MFNNKYCSPSKKKNKYSCYSLKSLKKIGNIWNNNQKTDIIPEEYLKENFNNKKKLVDILRHHLIRNSTCKEEWCWLENKYIKKKY